MIGRTQATAKDDVRRLNQGAVFQVVHRQGPVSRVDIATRLHLSAAAVTNITSDLIDRGLAFEARKDDRGGVGRRRILLEVAYGTGHVAGIKVANTGLTCASPISTPRSCTPPSAPCPTLRPMRWSTPSRPPSSS